MSIIRGKTKKDLLLEQREKLLQEIKYYQRRIKDLSTTVAEKLYVDSSSDSEDDFPTIIGADRSFLELKTEQTMLKTCLQATTELTNLTLLEYSVNVLVTDPIIEGEPPITEEGLWQEVTAEARVDLVPFNMTFYVHTPSRRFGPKSYRCLKVSLLKEAHEMELADSLLKKLRTPSDAVGLLRNYATAIRSRRNTLARLGDKYAYNLHMEQLAEGGYVLKCANILTLSWRLECKKSHLANFQHVMKFDLEYMEESHLKIISQSHKQLANPMISTGERTELLSNIISTCLEACGLEEQSESIDTDQESIQNIEKRHTLVQESEEPVAKKNKNEKERNDQNRDEEIMAPPKSIPKKGKLKGKENIEQNRKSVKRSNAEETNIHAKKPKSNKKVANDAVENKDSEVLVEITSEKTITRKDKTSLDEDKKNKVKSGKTQIVVGGASIKSVKDQNIEKPRGKEEESDNATSTIRNSHRLDNNGKSSEKDVNMNVQEKTKKAKELEQGKKNLKNATSKNDQTKSKVSEPSSIATEKRQKENDNNSQENTKKIPITTKQSQTDNKTVGLRNNPNSKDARVPKSLNKENITDVHEAKKYNNTKTDPKNAPKSKIGNEPRNYNKEVESVPNKQSTSKGDKISGKITSGFKSKPGFHIKQQSIRKPVTGIPKLINKPIPKRK